MFTENCGCSFELLRGWQLAGIGGMYPGAPEFYPKKPIFGRPKIIKNSTFRLSDPTSGPGIGTSMAENPPYLILSSGG